MEAMAAVMAASAESPSARPLDGKEHTEHEEGARDNAPVPFIAPDTVSGPASVGGAVVQKEKRRSSRVEAFGRGAKRLVMSLIPLGFGRAPLSPALAGGSAKDIGDGAPVGLRRMVNSYTDLGGMSGVCGLSNLGNTCFMNAILQCISNTPGLADYLIANRHKTDINTDNPMGTKGEVVEQLSILLKAMWSGQHKSVAPRDFKAAIAKFAPQFGGYGQHDAQEFMSFLMDAVHEDLNRISKKPYREDPDGADGRTDEDVAAECWKNHRDRNDSVIVDAFQGQMRSVLVCGGCGNRSVRFDPYMYLSVPLPDYTVREMAVTVVPADASCEAVRAICHVHRQGTILDLRKALVAQRPAGIAESAEVVIAEVFLHRFHKFYSDSHKVESILDKDVIFAIEMPKESSPSSTTAGGDSVTVAVTHVLSAANPQAEQERFGVPSLVRVSRGCTHRELADTLAASLVRQFGTSPAVPSDSATGTSASSAPVPMAKDPTVVDEVHADMAMDITDAVGEMGDHVEGHVPGIPRRRRVTFGPMAVSPPLATSTAGDPSAAAAGVWDADWGRSSPTTAPAAARPRLPGGLVRIVDGQSTRVDWDRVDWQTRLRRPSAAGKYLRAPFTLGRASGVAIDPACDATPLADECAGSTVELVAWWDPGAPETGSLRAAIAASTAGDPADPRRRGSQAVLGLNDCLELFMHEERLSGEDCWRCPKCKETSPRTTKALALWTLPDLLVVHLKRFCYTARWATKLEQAVLFPTVGLDLSRHVTGPAAGQPAVYDLYAVCNHFGGIGGGHYTAHCRNRHTGAFYDFDDSHTTLLRQESFLSKNAYVLFYVRRGTRGLVTPGILRAGGLVQQPTFGFVIGDEDEGEGAAENQRTLEAT